MGEAESTGTVERQGIYTYTGSTRTHTHARCTRERDDGSHVRVDGVRLCSFFWRNQTITVIQDRSEIVALDVTDKGTFNVHPREVTIRPTEKSYLYAFCLQKPKRH